MEANNRMIRVFPPSIHYATPNGEVNFQGAVKEMFEEINKDVSENVKNDYFVAYINRIFPIFNTSVPLKDYDDVLINNKILELQSYRAVLDETIKSDYRHLILDPIKYHRKKHDSNYEEMSYWGSVYKFHEEKGENQESTLSLIPKSFGEEIDQTARVFFLNCEDADGETFGLAVMYFIGARENEICGINYSDVIEMQSHPDCHYIISGYVTTGKNTNKLEPGGKTRNAEKRTPIETEFYQTVKRRMDKIEKETGKSCLNLPVACRGHRYDVRCDTNDLSVAGRRFFKDILHIRENDLAGIAVEMEKLKDTPFEEKEPTTYLFRRNFATRIGNLRNDKNGLSLSDLQYLQSHDIEDTKVKRWDYNDDEVLYKLYLKMFKK